MSNLFPIINKETIANHDGDTVTLNIDYGNGASKRFDNVPLINPWTQRENRVGVTDVFEIARYLQPGLSFTFEESFVDRGGRSVGQITEVDAVEFFYSLPGICLMPTEMKKAQRESRG